MDSEIAALTKEMKGWSGEIKILQTKHHWTQEDASVPVTADSTVDNNKQNNNHISNINDDNTTVNSDNNNNHTHEHTHTHTHARTGKYSREIKSCLLKKRENNAKVEKVGDKFWRNNSFYEISLILLDNVFSVCV